MYILYSFLLMIIFMLVSYPYLKFYQLNGYKIKIFLSKIIDVRFKLNDKNKLLFTKRIYRFLIIYSIVLLGIFIPIFLFIINFWLIFLDVLILALLLPIIISFAHLLISPIEILIKKYYLKKTKRRLDSFKGIKIAIVGSFGKTSVKNILLQLLSKDFDVVATPMNYNTPMGICKTVSDLKKDPEILIFEMGARKKGDIKELMQLVNPDFGIMTAVGQQHLETFGDLDTIKNTKFELVKYMNLKGRIIFNNACETTKELYKKCDKKKYSILDKSGFAYYENLAYTSKGLSFDLCIKNKKQRVQTRLLGRLNCENIVLASAMAYILGVKFEDLSERILNLKPTKSRLELIDNGRFLIIDDSYNANVEGTRQSLEVLNLFEGKKIVITSGLVELGPMQYEKNYNLGKQISKVADIVLIMNETNKKSILAGLKQGGFGKPVYFAHTREEQKKIINQIAVKDCIILFQNDLPDNYR